MLTCKHIIYDLNIHGNGANSVSKKKAVALLEDGSLSLIARFIFTEHVEKNDVTNVDLAIFTPLNDAQLNDSLSKYVEHPPQSDEFSPKYNYTQYLIYTNVMADEHIKGLFGKDLDNYNVRIKIEHMNTVGYNSFAALVIRHGIDRHIIFS